MQALRDRLTEPEKAYIAGIMDGEGLIGYYFQKSKNRHEATVTITNTDPRLMNWLQEKIGYGNVKSERSGYSRRKHVCHVWCISNKPRVRDFLEAITPYLMIKQDQAKLLLNLWETEGKQYVERTPEIVDHRNTVAGWLKELKYSHKELVESVN